MSVDNDNESLPETHKMLPASNKSFNSIVIEPSNLEKPPKNSRKESLGEYLKNLESLTPAQIINTYSSKLGVFHQCLAVFGVLVLTIGAGHPIGFSAVLLPQLEVENSTLQMDLEMGSWIASVHSAASPIGSLIAGPTMERWGRKTTLELSIPALVLGWVVISTAPNIPLLILGRLLCGYGVGYIAATGQVYLGEISDSSLRGMLIGTPFISYSIGVLFVYNLGKLPWRWTALIGVSFPILSYLLLFRVPESPVWLSRHGRLSRAHAAFKWLRGEEALANKELHELLSANAKERQETIRQPSTRELLRQPAIYKPLIIILIFNTLQLLSGTYVVIFYAVDIVNDIAKNSLDSSLAMTYSIYIAIARLAFAVIGCFLLLHMTRRKLYVMSGTGSTLACIALGIFIVIRKNQESTSLDIWVAVSCLFIYIASNTIGFMMIPSLLVGELLPAKIRGMYGGYIFTIFNIVLFICTKMYPFIKTHCGMHGLFFIFGISSLIGTIFLYLFVPETKNKSLIQIEGYFKNSNIIWRKSNMPNDEIN